MRRFHCTHRMLFLLAVLVTAACAEIRVSAIPEPAASPKLRVYVEPFTTFAEPDKHGKPGWDTPHEEFVETQVRLVEKYLAQTGIYEIVSREDVRAAVGDQKLSRYSMERNNWALAKKIGKAVHADYVMVLERGTNSLLREKYFFNALVNVETGAKFGVQYSFEKRGIQGRMKEIVRASYRDIFKSAKDDLFATAMKKSERIGSSSKSASTPETVESPPVKQEEVRQPEVKITQDQRGESAPMAAAVSPDKTEKWIVKNDYEDALTQDQGVSAKTKLVVYDLDSPEQYKPAALILSESLREEMFKLKKFTLVNREDLEQVLKEMALQQTGLIDEKDAVKTGRGMAANQVVTGKMGILGKTFVLQAKRINVETFATLGLASTKFGQGHEEEAFDKMQDFAKHLAEEQTN
jgi:hypothetical protein